MDIAGCTLALHYREMLNDSRMVRLSRRAVVKGAGAMIAASAAPSLASAAQRVIVNDASRLNPTPVVVHLNMRSDSEAELIARLREEMKAAVAAKRPFAVGVARHSMGGQSIPRDGTAITFGNGLCEIDSSRMTFRASAGTTWRDVIATLDKAGFSPAVMQSNNDFGVGSTFCVNAHGWPVPYGPFGSTVKAVRLMMADGSILKCSPEENSELFGLAMGGYGLFGVVLDVEAAMVPNALLKPTFEKMPSRNFAQRFLAAIADDRVKMAYGRLSVASRSFFEEALLCSYRPLPTPAEGLPPATSKGSLTTISREIYRAQIGSDVAKRARWLVETKVGTMGSGAATRNSLMNEPVSNLADRETSRTDILHEYFVSPERFPEFVRACQDVIPSSGLEFLNVTLRYIKPDPQSVLAFAREQRIAAVMSFSQSTAPEGERKMLAMTEALIDRVIDVGGAFYLPYRLHARRDQVRAVYPRFDEFVERKKHYDPGMLFRNLMWGTYVDG
jgi:FAD/FMN-containing dehydrogenase